MVEMIRSSKKANLTQILLTPMNNHIPMNVTSSRQDGQQNPRQEWQQNPQQDWQQNPQQDWQQNP
ncbi:MAG: hypothetical protein LIO63_06710, partial [Akkermansia sp.]|nr:hypothetical protein [Akkermansia sp.]